MSIATEIPIRLAETLTPSTVTAACYLTFPHPWAIVIATLLTHKNKQTTGQVAIDRYYYPDVTVSCDENEAENALNSPRVIFEVLSPSTEVIDRTEKLEAYRELLSVEDYMLVSSERQAVEVHHRDRKQNYWITRIYGPGDTVRIESLNAEFLMDEIYERVRFKQ